nr:AfsR/SARP family transcriptional regulator [Amycolatopsis aidingensis]
MSTPSAPKLQRVVSLLVMRSNSVVRNEQLVEELWEDKPPASVATTLHTYIYQLRKLLKLRAPEHAGSASLGEHHPALHSFPNGYMLTLPPESLDVNTFETLARRGRAHLEAGEVLEAADTLAGALALWRGPALVNVEPGPVLGAEVLRLEELRKSTLELRIEADLQLGRHHSLLSELTKLVAQEPTHEGFQGKLMLALYRAGRRSEALHAYQQTRVVLANELGLDPSRDIQRLHRAVLTSDSSLDLAPGSHPARTSARPSAPSRLASEGLELVGRKAAIDEATTILTPATHGRPVVVTGLPGSGKSALCVQVARRLAEQYPDGQLFAQLLDNDGTPIESGTVLLTLLRQTGMRAAEIPSSFEERLRVYRDWTACHQALIVLDDVIDNEQLLTMRPGGRGCALLVAGRRRLSVPYTAVVDLRPLSISEGVELLADVLGAQRLTRDIESAHELVQICDGLPVALHAAAGRLQLRPHWSISRTTRWLNEELPKAPETGADPVNLRPSVERTYRLMPEPAKAAFRTVSGMDAGYLSITTAAHALGLDEHGTESLLEELAEVRLLEIEPVEAKPDQFRYWFLPGVRTIGRQLQQEHHRSRQRHRLHNLGKVG